MCGIWFYLKRSKGKISVEMYQKLNDSFNKIENRGPDNKIFRSISYHQSIKGIVGFHRLAIMDPSPIGNQPFSYNDLIDNIIVVCNGEIYNHKELIIEHDLHPNSKSDCEVIIELYKKYRDVDKIVNLINGEYSFVIYHRSAFDNKIQLFAATDQISVRPLFIGKINNKDIDTEVDFVFSSEMKGLECCDSIERIKPGHILKISYYDIQLYGMQYEKYYEYKYYPYYEFNYSNKNTDALSNIYSEITQRLSNAVKKRIQSDRPIGCLLSGGLDSSLVACLLARHMKEIDSTKNIDYFSIGNSDAPDVVNAILVFNHIKKNINPNVTHYVYDISFEEALDIIPEVIRAIETYDITTIRASTWQYLLAKKISENTNVKVILNGDGADEIEMGYQYFKNAPNATEAQLETEKLIKELHLYDCLRVDRAISYHGLEARVPFLDIEFFDYYMKINPELKMPTEGIEKYLIRKAFEIEDPNLLCKEVLWRKKEAFSDGVSKHIKSWYEIIQENVEKLITDEEYNRERTKYIHLPPVSKESYYFRKIYEENYKNRENIIEHFWLPNWSGNITEPSARVLKVYQQ